MKPKQDNVQVKMPDDLVGGTYANQMIVHHTNEEFVLDFVSLFRPGGKVVARVIVSPGHAKRMVAALSENLRKYEAQFGAIADAAAPTLPPDGYTN